MALMTIFWIALLIVALWPFRAWKHKPLGMRILLCVGIFTVPFGIALMIDGVRGGVFVLAAGVASLIAVTYFDFKFRAS